MKIIQRENFDRKRDYKKQFGKEEDKNVRSNGKIVKDEEREKKRMVLGRKIGKELT